jgi:hypothetical protein
MNAKVAETTHDTVGLQAWHRQARTYLARLEALSARIQADDPDTALRTEAGAIEAFFSDTSRRHRTAVERNVFPPTLASGQPDRITTVRRLQQDQGWLDENWIELAPKLRAISDGNLWIDPAEFGHEVEVYRELCRGNIELEETLIRAESTLA